jgi:hypothetical protein
MELAAFGEVVRAFGHIVFTVAPPIGDKIFHSVIIGNCIRRGGQWQLLSWQTTPVPAC